MKAFLEWSTEHLNQAGIDSPRMEAEVLLAGALRLCREEIYRRPERILSEDEKSQHKNKDKAMKVLRARLYDLEQSKQQDEIARERKQQVGSGDRSERIRTYNFSQERVTDHRIGLTLHKLTLILQGDLNEIIDALTVYYQAEALKQGN